MKRKRRNLLHSHRLPFPRKLTRRSTGPTAFRAKITSISGRLTLFSTRKIQNNSMRKKPYYSLRTGKNPHAQHYDLSMLRLLFIDLFNSFDSRGYFQESFGYDCVDAGYIPGKLGDDIGAYVRRKLRKINLWPISSKYEQYSEDDVFDVVEFLYDHVSKPLGGSYHSWNDCGWHYDTFDSVAGRREFLPEVNELLRDYRGGYELSEEGEILELAEQGFDSLLQAKVPTHDPSNIEDRVKSAILKFRRTRSSADDRRDAIRDLADVLEFVRPKLKGVLTSEDENDLFNIANNFGILHHSGKQKTDYDKPIWYSWMFYYYLTTIHAALRLIEKSETGTK
jgi:hypothetical protein